MMQRRPPPSRSWRGRQQRRQQEERKRRGQTQVAEKTPGQQSPPWWLWIVWTAVCCGCGCWGGVVEAAAAPAPRRPWLQRRVTHSMYRSPSHSRTIRSISKSRSRSARRGPRGYTYYGPQRRQRQTGGTDEPSMSSSSSLSSLSRNDNDDKRKDPPPPRSYYSRIRQYRINEFSWTHALMVANGLVYVLQTMRPRLTKWGMKRSDLIFQGGEWHRLVTPVLLHANPLHLMINMSALQNVGKFVELYFGATRFWITYLAAGVAGNVLSAYQTPAPSVGASGAIFGLLGAQTMFVQRHASDQYAQANLANLWQTLLLNVVYGMTNPAIDNWAHVGGFLGGAFMAVAIGPNLKRVYYQGRSVIVDEPMIRVPDKVQNVLKNIMPRKIFHLRLPRFLRGNRPPPPPRISSIRPGTSPWW